MDWMKEAGGVIENGMDYIEDAADDIGSMIGGAIEDAEGYLEETIAGITSEAGELMGALSTGVIAGTAMVLGGAIAGAVGDVSGLSGILGRLPELLIKKPLPAMILWQKVQAGKVDNKIGDARPKEAGQGGRIADTSIAEVLYFDCFEAEDFAVQSVVTQYQVDTGFAISDHVVRQQPHIRIKGMVVNTKMKPDSLDMSDPLGAGLSGILKIAGTVLGTTAGGIFNDILNARAAIMNKSGSIVLKTHTALKKLVDEGTVVTIVTVKGVLTNCVIVGYGYSDTADTSNQLSFYLEAKQVRIYKVVGSAAQVKTFPTLLKKVSKKEGGIVMSAINKYGLNVLGSLLR